MSLSHFMRPFLQKGAHAAPVQCGGAGNPGTLRSGWQRGERRFHQAEDEWD
jgi:hypothetical protein